MGAVNLTATNFVQKHEVHLDEPYLGGCVIKILLKMFEVEYLTVGLRIRSKPQRKTMLETFKSDKMGFSSATPNHASIFNHWANVRVA